MHNLIIYKASAGSGKTYKLTEEYLRLAFRVPFHRILAVTFTNKATAEMKERITGVLATLAGGGDSPYLEVISQDTGMDHASVRRRAGSLLDAILQNYSRFSVGTIDSFFQQVIRGFAREAGLQSGFELELDNGKVLARVIDRLIVGAAWDEGLCNWLMSCAEGRIREGRSWNFRQDISRLGREIFSEKFMEFGKGMSARLSDREFMREYLEEMYALKGGFEKQMKDIGTSALALMGERGLSVSDFSYGSGGVAGWFEKIASGTAFEPGKRVTNAENDPEAWSAKNSPRRNEITAAVEGGLNTILCSALELYRESFVVYNSSLLVLKNFYTLGILNDIIVHLRSHARENNLFLLSDVATLLSGIIGTNDAPFIYEKIGQFYRHFMIDEFQDTSSVQWKNFVPLIRESLAGNNRNILVGDVKQSIYRWRNGDWRILSGGIERDLQVFAPRVLTLEVNWRSMRKVVEFNNYLFRAAPVLIKNHLESEFAGTTLRADTAPALLRQIDRAYGGNEQRMPDPEASEGGHINIRFLPNSDREWRKNALDGLPALLADIRSRGYNLRDIAILVRNNSDGREIAGRLLDWQAEQEDGSGRLDFVSEEFLLLQESPPVMLLVALMGLLSDADNRIAKAVILKEYYRYHMNGKQLQLHDLFSMAGDSDTWPDFFPGEFMASKRNMEKLSLYELVERLISVFGLGNRPEDIPYLTAFQDAVLDFSRREGGGSGRFLKWWEENCGKLAVCSNERQDAVRIMTIHKAKGLQFKIVLIPFGEWDLDHSHLHDNFLWCRPSCKPFDRLDLVPVKYSSKLGDTIFASDYCSEKMQVYVDNLNLLYVAFTRAEEELHVFTPAPGRRRLETGSTSRISELLYRLLADNVPAGQTAGKFPADSRWNGEEMIFTCGSMQVNSQGTGPRETGMMAPGNYHVSEFRERLRLRINGGSMEAGEKERMIDRGRLLHGIFEKIITRDDITPAVMQKYREGIISREEAGELESAIREMTAAGEVAGWFDGSWKVRNEAAILLEDGSTKRPDRVMIKDGQVVVVDYKFGEQSADPRYRSQVRRYMKELRGMGHNDPAGFIWYAIAGIIDRVDPDPGPDGKLTTVQGKLF